MFSENYLQMFLLILQKALMNRMGGYSESTRTAIAQIREESRTSAKCGALVAYNDILTASPPNTQQLEKQVLMYVPRFIYYVNFNVRLFEWSWFLSGVEIRLVMEDSWVGRDTQGKGVL